MGKFHTTMQRHLIMDWYHNYHVDSWKVPCHGGGWFQAVNDVHTSLTVIQHCHIGDCVDLPQALLPNRSIIHFFAFYHSVIRFLFPLPWNSEAEISSFYHVHSFRRTVCMNNSWRNAEKLRSSNYQQSHVKVASRGSILVLFSHLAAFVILLTMKNANSCWFFARIHWIMKGSSQKTMRKYVRLQ